MSAHRSSLPAASACPATVTVPAVGCSSPAISSSRVDFPQPLGPTTPVTVPGSTASETASRASRSPNRFVTPVSSIRPEAVPTMACIPSLA